MATTQQQPTKRRAVALIAVLVVVVILSLLGYQFLDVMFADFNAAVNVQRSAQVRSLADSGVHHVMTALSTPAIYEGQLAGNPYHDAGLFANQVVVEDEAAGIRGMFSVLSPVQVAGTPGGEGEFRFGAIDENGKINLNAMMKVDDKGDKLFEMLKKLPPLEGREDVAAAIVDWLDNDIEPREGGAEDEVYAAKDPPYRCKNGPITCLDELMLVEGMDDLLLWGDDRNRNGMIDPIEMQNAQIDDHRLSLGLAAYLTVWSREQNTTKDHKLRININERDMAALHDKMVGPLGTALANYIVLYRQNGGRALSIDDSGNVTESEGGDPGSAEIDLNKRGRRRLKSLMELVNSEVSVRGSRNSPSTVYASPLNDEGVQEQYLPVLFDLFSVQQETDIPARININTCPDPVIDALPDLEPDDIDKIKHARPAPGTLATASPNFQTPAWLITHAQLRPDVAQKLEKLVTTRSQVYRVQVIGHYENSPIFSRVEAVIDINAGRPRILFYRDLTRLGRGFQFPVMQQQ